MGKKIQAAAYNGACTVYGKKLRSISDHWSNLFFGLDGASKNSNLKSAVDLNCKPEFSIYLIIFSQQDLGNNCDHYELWSTLKFNVCIVKIQ